MLRARALCRSGCKVMQRGCVSVEASHAALYLRGLLEIEELVRLFIHIGLKPWF